MQGKARSIERDGFEFVQIDLNYIKPHHWKREKPKWFQEQMNLGNIAPVVNEKQRHVTLRNKNASFTVYEGDYIVRNSDGLIFWMPRDLFESSFIIE